MVSQKELLVTQLKIYFVALRACRKPEWQHGGLGMHTCKWACALIQTDSNVSVERKLACHERCFQDLCQKDHEPGWVWHLGIECH